MEPSVVFVDCPAYLDDSGSVRCALPAEVEDRYTMRSTGGAPTARRIPSTIASARRGTRVVSAVAPAGSSREYSSHTTAAMRVSRNT